MLYFFTGNYKGEKFIGVRAPKPEQRFLAGIAIDTLSDRYGPKIPEVNKNNALIRKLSAEVLPQMVEFKLKGIPQYTVQHLAEVVTEDLEPYFTPAELAAAFVAPSSETDEQIISQEVDAESSAAPTAA